MRKHRAKVGPKMLESDQLRRLLDALEGKEAAEASLQMRAMLLLGLNCGYGNTDVATLPLSAFDLNSG